MVDHWLELAKLARYVHYQVGRTSATYFTFVHVSTNQKVCDVAFAMFAVTWVYTRLAVYPTYLIYSTR